MNNIGKLCECNCGEFAKPGNKFINGHNNRGKSIRELGHKKDCNCPVCKSSRGELKKENHPMYGKHHSEETIVKMSVAKSGKKYSVEHIINISIGRKNFLKENPEKHNFYVDGSCCNGKYPSYHINFTEEFRQKIRERDNHICQLCKLTEDKFDEKLSVHHIHYDEETNDCSNFDDFISLCRSCHGVTSVGNRAYWENKLTCSID